MSDEVRRDAAARVARQQAFFSAGRVPDLLVFITEDPPRSAYRNFKPRLNALIESRGGVLPGEVEMDRLVSQVVPDFREHWAWHSRHIPDDAVPELSVSLDIGIQTAMMTGLTPRYMSERWWLEPQLDWAVIDELALDPDGDWLQLVLSCNRALWRYWEEDYFFLPTKHRSPLDAANGIRGNALFEEMYTAPDRVKKLVDWCVDCELAIERLIAEQAGGPREWGIGIQRVWMPGGAVWVNGDPVTMISREMMIEFDQPYTGRLFTTANGGFFHNHTSGLYQVDQIVHTPGTILQHFNRDPNCPRVSEAMREDPVLGKTIVASSLVTPIYIDNVDRAELPDLKSFLPEGRFILEVICTPQETDAVLAEVRALVPSRRN